MAKLLFQWVYWHVLLPGHDIPGIGSQLHAGKDPAADTKENHDDTATLEGTPVDLDAEGFLQQARAVDPRDGATRSPATTASPSSPTATGRSSTSCAPPTSRPASAPTIRSLGKVSGVPIKELYQLFPKGPAKLAAKIAGIPKPRGCI